MLLVGLTGGIGAGKSTVARMLAAHGAVVIDADELARRAIDPGTPGYVKVRHAFRSMGIFTPEGEVDRQALADIVFADKDARERLERIVHPEVARLFSEEVAPHVEARTVVVYAVPLLAEKRLRDAFDAVVTVEAPEEVRIDRVTADRDLTADAARARVAAQATDAERTAVADVVLANDGTLEELRQQVDALWEDLAQRARIIESR